MMKKVIIWLILLCCFALPAVALEKGFGQIAMDQVNLRKGPAGDTIGKKQKGDPLFILGEETRRGHTWYRVSTMNETGKKQIEAWVRADMVIPPSQLFQNITAISGETSLFMALDRNGIPHFGGLLHIAHENPTHWRDVKAIDIGFHTFYALQTDGTVLREGIRGPAPNHFHQRFVAMSGYDDLFLGQTTEGALLKLNGYSAHQLLPEGSEIRDFAAWSAIYGLGAYVDGQGKVHLLEMADLVGADVAQEMSSWSDVLRIKLGREVVGGKITRPVAAALKADGSVLMSHKDLQAQVSGWQNITQIVLGNDFLVGLTGEGKLLCTKPSLAAETAGWTDLIDIACGDEFIAGLTKDGKVLFAGEAWFGLW
jgi:hypothetical protein